MTMKNRTDTEMKMSLMTAMIMLMRAILTITRLSITMKSVIVIVI